MVGLILVVHLVYFLFEEAKKGNGLSKQIGSSGNYLSIQHAARIV